MTRPAGADAEWLEHAARWLVVRAGIRRNERADLMRWAVACLRAELSKSQAARGPVRGRPMIWTHLRQLYLHGELMHLRVSRAMTIKEACAHLAAKATWSRFLATSAWQGGRRIPDPSQTLCRQYQGDKSDIARLADCLRRDCQPTGVH
jgi:hypothetical protein